MAASLSSQNKLENLITTAQNIQESWTLKEAYQRLEGDQPLDIPFLIWLVENPDSPIALPGKIDLYRHDCLHILFDLDFSFYSEAFIIGFTMQNDCQTNWLHIALFKFLSIFLYPKHYRFNLSHLKSFDLGVLYAQKILVKNLNQFEFYNYQNQTLSELRKKFKIDPNIIKILVEVCSSNYSGSQINKLHKE